jgi:hypothetical protein
MWLLIQKDLVHVFERGELVCQKIEVVDAVLDLVMTAFGLLLFLS